MLAVLATAALFTGCQKQADTKQPAPSAISAKLQSGIKFPEMIAVAKDRLPLYYTNLDTSELKSFSVYICSSLASADEIAVFQCDSDADADKAKAAVQDRIDSKADTFKNYGAPKEYTDIKNCVFETKGNYVILAVTGDNGKAKTTIDSFF
jgi:hypothetical protein